MDPDPGGPKTRGCVGSGSTTLVGVHIGGAKRKDV